MKRSDRELEMDRAITRRDFFSGVEVVITGTTLAGSQTASRSAQAAQVDQVAQVENPAATGAMGPQQEAAYYPPGAMGMLNCQSPLPATPQATRNFPS